MNVESSTMAGIYADVSLTAILRRIREHWLLFWGSVVICLSLAIAIAVLSTPIYQSFTLLSPAGGASGSSTSIGRLLQSFGGGGFFGGNSGGARNARAVGLAALSSPFFTRAFIEDNNLLPLLFPDKWDSEANEWLVDDPKDIPTLQDGYELFANDILTVEEEELSSLVTVSVDWKDPQLAAEWVNMLVASVNERLRQQAITDADLTIEYLNEELGSTSAVQLQQAIYFLIEAEIQKRTVAKVQKEYAFKVVSPATPSDPDRYIWPNRAFIVSVGLGAGLFLGFLLVLTVPTIRKAFRNARQAA